jgi:hypothetical protein
MVLSLSLAEIIAKCRWEVNPIACFLALDFPYGQLINKLLTINCYQSKTAIFRLILLVVSNSSALMHFVVVDFAL